MPQVPLCLETLGRLDNGSAALIIDSCFQEAARDLDERGEDGKERIVEIFVRLKKGAGGSVVASVEARSKQPARKTAEHLCKTALLGRSPALLFQPSAPEDPDQKTIDDLAGGMQ